MPGGTARRDFSHALAFGLGPTASAKMAPDTATRGGRQETELERGDSIADQDGCSSGLAGPTVSTHNHGCMSAASMESPISRTLDDMLLSPVEDLMASQEACRVHTQGLTSTPQDFSSMMAMFDTMLSKGLSQTANQITTAIQADLQLLCARIETIEIKADQTKSRVNQNTTRIQDLQDQLENAFSKIYNLENRSRRYNFRIQGVPKDADHIVRTFIKELDHSIPDHRLEMDRAHRALQPPAKTVSRETL